MTITATELKYSLGKYLKLVDSEDITIKKNGRVIAIMANPHKSRFDIIQNLQGILPSDVNENSIREKRILNK